jgi:hypothetical protein
MYSNQRGKRDMLKLHSRKSKYRVQSANEFKRALEAKIAANNRPVIVIPHGDRQVEQLTGRQLERFLSRVSRRKENLV